MNDRNGSACCAGSGRWAQCALEYVVLPPAGTAALPDTAGTTSATDDLGAACGPGPDTVTHRRMAALVGAA